MEKNTGADSVDQLAQLGGLIDRIYQAAMEPHLWNFILPEISEWVGARFGLLFTPLHTSANGGFYFNHAIPEYVMELWATRWKNEDVISQRGIQQGMFVEGNVATGEQIIPFEEYRESRIYKELNHPNGIDHMIQSAVFDPTSKLGIPATVLSFYRGIDVGPFGRDSVEKLKILLPHVSRSLAVMSKLRDAELRITASHSALDRLTNGVLLIGQCGQVLFANRAAKRVLEDDDGLTLQHYINGKPDLGRLIASDQQAQTSLRAAIQSAVDPDLLHTEHFSRAVVIPRSSGRQDYTLNFSTLAPENEFGSGDNAPRAIAFITDSADPIRLDAELLKHTYNLTPAEIRVTALIAEGHTVDEVAEKLDLSRSTVKTQLQSVYEKTNTNNRAKLMKLIMSLSSVNC